MKVYVMSRMMVEDPNWIDAVCGYVPKFIISVTDPRSEPANIKGSMIYDIVRLQFDDVDEIRIDGDVLFEKSHADEIIGKFYTALLSGMCDEPDGYAVIFHCEAGVSRSAGLAAAWANYYLGDDKFFFDNYIPNRHVYRIMLNALMELF